MDSRIAVIMNSCSGKNASSSTEVEREFFEQAIDAKVVCLEGVDARAETESLMKSGYDIIVVAGGDGTVSAVASVVAGTQTLFGVLPLGSLNHFAKDLGIPLTLREAVRTISDGCVTAVDVGDVNGRVFVNNVSVGLYPAFVEIRGEVRREPLLSRWLSIAAAAITVLRKMPLLRVRVNVDGTRLKRLAPVVFIGNNRYALEGPQIGSRTSLSGGRLSVILTRSGRPWGLLKLIARAALGSLRGAKDLDELVGRVIEVQIKGNRAMVAADGEVVEGIGSPLVCKVRPGALRVLVPSQAIRMEDR